MVGAHLDGAAQLAGDERSHDGQPQAARRVQLEARRQPDPVVVDDDEQRVTRVGELHLHCRAVHRLLGERVAHRVLQELGEDDCQRRGNLSR